LEENIQPEDIAKCRDEFNIAFLELVKGAQAPAATTAAPSGEAIKTVGPFMVYFGFNSASLDSAAKALIDSLASHKFSGDELGYIVLSGHTDRAGNSAYNEALSDRRATTVSDAFMAKGVKARILSSFYGEDRPVQATADGAREPKNRRVEITLSR
ncbi:MAG: OmpA family protein, partial [Rhodospirillales bacterium]|nr:OmpA family protein [Rhodospirillales bacterium]